MPELKQKPAQKARAATRREHLTERRIGALPVPTRRVTIYDARVPALGLKLEPSGQRRFFWFRAVNGKAKWINIGVWPDIDLDTARKKAEEHNVTLATWQKDGSVGPNPFERTRPSKQPTLDGLIEDYITRHIMLASANPAKAAKGIRWMRDKYLSDWKDRRLGSITRQDVYDLHRKIGTAHGKVTANRVGTLLRTLFNYATGDAGLWRGENPAARLEKFDESQRERYLSPEELLRLNAALASEPDVDLRDFVTIALATGARKGNVHAMAWADISSDTLSWTIQRTKNKKPHLVDLTPVAVAVLRARRARRKENDPWVFPSPTSASGHAEDFKKQWKALLIRAGLHHPKDPARHVTQHDLRRTRASYMAIAGVSLQQIGAVLGHLNSSSTTVYARLHREAVKNAMTSGDRKMASMMAAAKRKQKRLPAPEGNS